MKYGFIGCGKMASALLQGALESGILAAVDVTLSDALPGASEELGRRTGARVVAGNVEVAAASDIVVLCVKPQDALAALRDMGGALSGKLLVSIVAGLPLSALQSAAAPHVRFVRVMPNTPALIHRGATAYALGAGATDDDATATERFFRAVGTVARVKEPLLDVVTGLSGSGPAFVYLVVEALADGGVLMGLPRDLALQLAAQTVAGSAEMVLRTGQHPATLRDQVTSPGGTTIAGIEALEKNGARAALIAAVRAATERARELGGGK